MPKSSDLRGRKLASQTALPLPSQPWVIESPMKMISGLLSLNRATCEVQNTSRLGVFKKRVRSGTVETGGGLGSCGLGIGTAGAIAGRAAGAGVASGAVVAGVWAESEMAQ